MTPGALSLPIVGVFEKVCELALSPTDSRALLIRVLQEEWHVS
nr:hypothetical protein [Kibdelosporangium sp. MJ126-NF4]CTQ91884.1 hypothetical protein [Kibdelosporangium sp. MJ126-NF4]